MYSSAFPGLAPPTSIRAECVSKVSEQRFSVLLELVAEGDSTRHSAPGS